MTYDEQNQENIRYLTQMVERGKRCFGNERPLGSLEKVLRIYHFIRRLDVFPIDDSAGMAIRYFYSPENFE